MASGIADIRLHEQVVSEVLRKRLRIAAVTSRVLKLDAERARLVSEITLVITSVDRLGRDVEGPSGDNLDALRLQRGVVERRLKVTNINGTFRSQRILVIHVLEDSTGCVVAAANATKREPDATRGMTIILALKLDLKVDACKLQGVAVTVIRAVTLRDRWRNVKCLVARLVVGGRSGVNLRHAQALVVHVVNVLLFHVQTFANLFDLAFHLANVVHGDIEGLARVAMPIHTSVRTSVTESLTIELLSFIPLTAVRHCVLI